MMSKRTGLVLVAAIAMMVMALAACKEKQAPAPAKEVPKAKKDAMAELQKKAEALKFEVCYGSFDKAAAKTIQINGKPYILEGSTLKPPADADSQAVIGIISDLKASSKNNLKAMKEYLDFFKSQGVELILVLGDTAEMRKDYITLLTPLLDSGLPVGVITGNRDPLSSYAQAVADLSAKYPNFINMNQVRVIDSEDYDIVSLPGYHDIRYVHHKNNSCVYGEKEIAELGKKIGEMEGKSVVLISHGPPKGEGKGALDYAFSGGNVGDPKLAKLIADKNIHFGLFGNIHEAGGKGVGKDLTTKVPEDTMVENLYINVGPGDTDPWNMNDDSVSYGMATVMKIDGKKASYKIYRRKNGNGEDSAEPAKPAGDDPMKKPLKLEPKANQAKPGLKLDGGK